MTSYRRVLVLGGVRSGKSRFARELAEASGRKRLFLATGTPGDDEMRERIDRHRAERDRAWCTREEPISLAEALAEECKPGRVVLVDCLTLWLSNLVLAGEQPDDAAMGLVRVLADAAGPVVVVSNEVGQGVVPATALGRAFRDAHGRLNQQVAAVCDCVVQVTAGCPLLLKPAPALSIRLR